MVYIHIVWHWQVTFSNQSWGYKRNSTWQRGQEAVAYVSQYHLTTFKCGCNSNSAGAMVSIIIYQKCFTCYCKFQEVRKINVHSYYTNRQIHLGTLTWKLSMLVEIQIDKSSFELRSNAVQSFLNVTIARSVSICERIKKRINCGSRYTSSIQENAFDNVGVVNREPYGTHDCDIFFEHGTSQCTCHNNHM